MENSFDRSMAILGLFSEDRPLITYQDVVDSFGFSKSSAYRYLGNLVAAGMLAQAGHAHYSLGPRIIELERLIVLSDPLLASGRKVMGGFTDDLPGSVLLLCSLWGEKVLCIHEARATLPPGADPFVPRRARGLPYSLFEGAASVVLLAHLPPYRLRSIFARHKDVIAAKGLGADWRAFSGGLRKIRTQGYGVSLDSFHTGRFSVAVPVLDASGAVAGSLARVADMSKGTDEAALTAVAAQVRLAAGAISAEMARLVPATTG